ncbi:uncharacterized protein LOC107266692 [Cephus cinctus]|uniref:Uncharacterized protein LOC107266692 n=1 Tax=Cephus cinctus TaxID=211228 RepID=A0AAJ7BSW4_CEPCN|nr:uncharacterized protein LOC107266692 [Cephus cinctus]
MARKFIIIYFTLILLSLLFLGANPVLVKTAYQNGDEYPRGCSYLRCAKGDQCVNRKFWCKNPPCPSMLYCSKSRKESLKGPSSCESVRCSKGYVCLVRARHCRWDQKCRQQIARCVSEREYYEGATSCADFRCPEGHQCILRESLCARPPCKLLKSCAKFKDVQIWFDLCKNRGCPSEHECFLRKPFEKCSPSPCKHTPDCSSTDDTEKEGSGNEYCRGWVCPRGQKCSAHIKEPCKLESCKIIRSCHGPLLLPENQPANSGTSSWKPAKYQPVTVIPTPPSSARNGETKNRKTLTQLEREFIQRDRNKGKPLSSTSATIGATTNAPRMRYTDLRNTLQQRDNFGIYRESNQLNDVISTVSTKTAMGVDGENLVYNEPNSVVTTIKPTSMTPLSSGILQSPTSTSLSSWLSHLKLKTGIDAIEQWVKNAQKRKHYPQFEEWLKSVKELLGPPIFETWLEEVRSLTHENPEFQEWLPKPRYQILDSHHFYDPDSRKADMENEGLTVFPTLERVKERSNENLIRKNNEKERSSSTVPDYYSFSSKRKNESERFLANFPENVVKYNQNFHSVFRNARLSTTTTTTAATPSNSAWWMKHEIPSDRIIHNNSLSQVSSENSVIYPQKLPTIATTITTWQNKNDLPTMKFEKSDSKLSNEFLVGENSYFEKPTDSPKDLGQPYRGVVSHQQEPEVETNLTNVPQFLSDLDYPYLTVNQNLSDDPYRSFENSINDPYVQTPIANELDYYSNPTRNVDSPGTIVYNVYRNDLQEIPPFTESYQISEYPFSHLSSDYPQNLVRNDFQNFWTAQQLASYLPRARTKNSNPQWTFSKYPDFNDMNMAVKSKIPYNKYPFNFGYYEGPANNLKPENNQYFIHPKLIQDHLSRNSRNLVVPKYTSFPYEPLFNDQNPIASRYMSLLGYEPQIPVDKKEQALTTYSLSRNPFEMNPFDRYPRPSVNYEKMDNPQMIRPYNAFLNKQILENTDISMGDMQRMGLQVLPQEYQGSLERQDLKRNHQLNTWKESEYRLPDKILPENNPKISDRYLSWKFPERQKVSQDRKAVVTSHPKSYKDISENRMSDIDRSYIFHRDDYVQRNGQEFTKSTESLPTEETKIANDYLSDIESSTVPNNTFQRQPSDYLTDEYPETLRNIPQNRHVERLTEISKNIVTTIPTDDTLLKFLKNNENERSSNDEIANENYKNYFENQYFENPYFQKNTDYMDVPTRDSSRLKNNSNHIFTMRSNPEFLKNHLNDNKNDAINSETTTVTRDQTKNIFKDEKYGGYADFPNNLKTVYNVANNVELKRLFGNYVVPRSSNDNMTIEEMPNSKSEQKNNDYEDEESIVDYTEIDKDNRFSQFVTRSSNPVSKIQSFQNGDIDYTNEQYEEEEYDVNEEKSEQDERYKEKQEKKE